MQDDTPLKRFFSSFGLVQKIALVVAILVVAGGVGLVVHHNQTIPDPNAGKYISKTDGFAVKFRTAPKINHATVSNATLGTLKQTTYETASADSSAAYAVAVVQYPSSYTFSETTLKQVAASQAKNSTDGKLLSETYVSYLGHETLESSYNTVSDGVAYTVYGIALADGHKLYNVYSIGASKDDFSTYVKTFVFVQ